MKESSGGGNFTKNIANEILQLEHKKIIVCSEIWKYILQVWRKRRFFDTLSAEKRKNSIGRKI